MSVGDNVNHEVNGKISIKTSLGTLHAEVVGEQGEYPGISVELEKADGSRGFVSLTEVCDGDLTYDGRTRLQTNCYDGVHEEPTAVECDPDGPFMSESAPELIGEKARDDRAWHESLVILETRGEDALLFNPSNAYSPFIVAAGFDHQSRSWSYGKYFSDVMSASCYLNEAVHPKYAVPGLTPSALEKISGLGLEANDDLDRVCRGVNSLLADRVSDYIEEMADNGDLRVHVHMARESEGEVGLSNLQEFAEGKVAEAEAREGAAGHGDFDTVDNRGSI